MTALIALMIAKAVLASTFAAAGIAKLSGRAATREMLSAFGAPERLVPSLAILLPLAEIATALGLIVPPSAWAAGVASTLLLFGFTAVIAHNLLAGRRPSCNCFGQIQAAPIGAWTLARNGLLCVLAVLVVAVGRASAGAWSTFGASLFENLTIVLGMACAGSLGVNIALTLRLKRQRDELRALKAPKPAAPAMTAGLAVGATAPGFRLKSQSGAMVSLEGLLSAGKPVVLIFTSPTCPPCAALARDITVWQDRYRDRVVAVKISEGIPSADPHPEVLLLQSRREVAEAYRCWGTPAAVLVQRDGTIASQAAQGVVAIRTLMENAAQSADGTQLPTTPAIKRGLDIGEAAPALRFTDQHGSTLALADFAGRDVALLFWDPDCGFCQKMLPALRLRDRSRERNVPALIVVSTAADERNRALGLSSSVVHDAGSQARSVFGVRGTPAAVLVDASGNVASGRAAGPEAVMSLVGGSLLVRDEAEASA